MTLLDVCEPLFVFACQINLFGRSRAEKNSSDQAGRLYEDLQRILHNIDVKVRFKPELIDQYQRVKPVMIYFVDWIGRKVLRENWKWPGALKGELGDDDFFILLDKTLADPSNEAKERLKVFYTCLGLGFVGSHGNDSKFLADKMRLVTTEIGTIFAGDPKAQICPGANKADTRVLTARVGQGLVGMAVLLAALVLIVFVANIAIYVERTKALSEIIKNVLQYQHQIDAAPSGT